MKLNLSGVEMGHHSVIGRGIGDGRMEHAGKTGGAWPNLNQGEVEGYSRREGVSESGAFQLCQECGLWCWSPTRLTALMLTAWDVLASGCLFSK